MKIINWCKENYLLTALIVFSFAIRLLRLDFQSPWADELFTLTNSHSNKSLGDIFAALKGDVHPPLYYYLVHFFMSVFGNTAYAARFVSVLFGVGGLVALYYLAKELFNKNVALLAVLLISINHFHIYYSQEARMYSMMFFSTTLSFLYLIRFVRIPTLKNALFFALTGVLLINTHFYSLFALCAQYTILLYFVIKPYNTTGKKMFLYSLMAGIITLVSFIPSLVIFLGTSGRNSFWITAPVWGVYTAMFEELLGSEIAVAVAVIATLYFLFRLFKEDDTPQYKIDPVTDRPVFAFHVLFIWIFVTIFFPYALSYIHLPMIVSRYFINILPPIFILIAAGMSLIKNNTVKATLLSVFMLYTLNDLVFVKKYYHNVSKTQYREASNYVKENRKNNEKIYSTFGIFFSYFLTPEDNNEVTGSSLNQIADRIMSNAEKPQSFWYIDIPLSNTANPTSEQTQKVLDSLFVVDKNAELFDAFAKHYHTKADYKPSGDFARFKPYKDRNGSDVNFSYEFVNDLGDAFEVVGWAYFNEQSAEHTKITVVLINGEEEIVLAPESVDRPDVTSYFKSQFDINNSGFKKQISKNSLKPGTYKLALYVADPVTKKDAFVISDKVITKQ
ncbi:hypothetical protein GR160_15210 [Flavobacterium sp. Sd200]|uniref:glycosyltransferase family 39 protein n=1 Tax=Flavobacterium sp. Sd200 TaxID=2692211 RepID=UPI00136AE43D|nr:glycosyltransferase family 39 protein [Flavobacterium sp. Sd200]MXN92576.1 hypothetical protein [Flavobacterium sp. Sd200]